MFREAGARARAGGRRLTDVAIRCDNERVDHSHIHTPKSDTSDTGRRGGEFPFSGRVINYLSYRIYFAVANIFTVACRLLP